MNILEQLKDARMESEQVYRSRVLEMLGAGEVPGLDPPSMVPRRRRVEGRLTITTREGVVNGLVVFATGNDGRGALADVTSAHGKESARSLLVESSADFVLLVTVGEPSPELVDLAERKGDPLYIGMHLQRSIWVIGVPEIVTRFAILGELASKPPVRTWWDKLLGRPGVAPEVPSSPLLVDL